MLRRLVEGLNYLIWWTFGSGFRVDAVVRRRLTLLATGSPEPDAAPDEVTSQQWAERYERIYELLGILNHKAEALMVYSGLTLAVIGVANTHRETCARLLCRVLPDQDIFSIIIAIVILVSIFLCLIVVGFYWSVFAHAIRPDGHGGTTVDYRNEWEKLLQAAVARQFFYQFAWLLAIVAWVLLVVFVLAFGL